MKVSRCASASLARSSLIVVNMQRDFMPGGACPIAGARDAIPAIAKAAKSFRSVYLAHEWRADDEPGERCVRGDLGSSCALPRWVHDSASGVVRTSPGEAGLTPLRTLFFGLKGSGFTNVYLCGLRLKSEILAAAREAINVGLGVHVMSNGCVSDDPKRAQMAVSEMSRDGVRVFEIEGV